MEPQSTIAKVRSFFIKRVEDDEQDYSQIDTEQDYTDLDEGDDEYVVRPILVIPEPHVEPFSWLGVFHLRSSGHRNAMGMVYSLTFCQPKPLTCV